jgi:hypothetical protein
MSLIVIKDMNEIKIDIYLLLEICKKAKVGVGSQDVCSTGTDPSRCIHMDKDGHRRKVPQKVKRIKV